MHVLSHCQNFRGQCFCSFYNQWLSMTFRFNFGRVVLNIAKTNWQKSERHTKIEEVHMKLELLFVRYRSIQLNLKELLRSYWERNVSTRAACFSGIKSPTRMNFYSCCGKQNVKIELIILATHFYQIFQEVTFLYHSENHVLNKTWNVIYE